MKEFERFSAEVKVTGAPLAGLSCTVTQERPGELEQPSPESLQSLFHQRGFPELNPGKEEKRVLLVLSLHCRDSGMVIPARQGSWGGGGGKAYVRKRKVRRRGLYME